MHSKNSNSLDQLHLEMRSCKRCLNEGHNIVPGAIFSGQLGAQVLVIGQAPGKTEVEANRPFNAGSGRRLFKWLGAAGWEEEDFRKDQYMTAVTKCYPGKNNSGRGDRVPSKEEQALCRPFLMREIAQIRPRVILPIGGLAIKLFYPSRMKLSEVIGTALFIDNFGPSFEDIFDFNKLNMARKYDSNLSPGSIWIIPLPHPSGASLWPNKPQNKVLIKQAIMILKQIRQDFRL